MGAKMAVLALKFAILAMTSDELAVMQA